MERLTLTLGTPSCRRCCRRRGAAWRAAQGGSALASPLAVMQSCRAPHANDAAQGIPAEGAQGWEDAQGRLSHLHPCFSHPSCRASGEGACGGSQRDGERARSCTAGKEGERGSLCNFITVIKSNPVPERRSSLAEFYITWGIFFIFNCWHTGMFLAVSRRESQHDWILCWRPSSLRFIY